MLVSGGYGKTYILEQLEKELEVLQNEETQNDRFYVFHYNCWQYDYYEEPAVAIVSAMLEKRGKDNKAGDDIAKRIYGFENCIRQNSR